MCFELYIYIYFLGIRAIKTTEKTSPFKVSFVCP